MVRNKLMDVLIDTSNIYFILFKTYFDLSPEIPLVNVGIKSYILIKT